MRVARNCIVLLLCALLLSSAAWTRPGRSLLIGVWTPDEVGLLKGSGIASGTGDQFALRLLDAIGTRADIGFSLRPMEQVHTRMALDAGTIDFALPVARTEAYTGVVWSKPYGQRTDLLFLRADKSLPDQDGVALLAAALRQGLRVGFVRGESYGPEVDGLLASPDHAGLVSSDGSDMANLERAMSGAIDAFVAPRLSGMSAIAATPGADAQVTFVPRALATHTLHIAFSAATVDARTLAVIDAAMESLRADGTEARLRQVSTTSVLLRLAAAGAWFNALDIVGTIAFALSGALIARKEGYSLFGAFVLALLPADGGGVIRDLLVGRSPIGLMESPQGLYLIIGTVAVASVLLRMHDRWRMATGAVGWLRQVFEVTDALGLAAFTVTGVVIAVRYGTEPLWLWGPICAFLSGAGGTVLRDLCRNGNNNAVLRTSFYAEVCLIWGLVLSLAVLWLAREEEPNLLRAAVIVTVVGAFATRMAAVILRVRSPQM